MIFIWAVIVGVLQIIELINVIVMTINYYGAQRHSFCPLSVCCTSLKRPCPDMCLCFLRRPVSNTYDNNRSIVTYVFDYYPM